MYRAVALSGVVSSDPNLSRVIIFTIATVCRGFVQANQSAIAHGMAFRPTEELSEVLPRAFRESVLSYSELLSVFVEISDEEREFVEVL